MAYKRTYKNKLRAIDQGTRYDVTGMLRKLERKIERGEQGKVSDVMVIVRTVEDGGGVGVEVFHYGNGGIDKAYYMVDSAKGQIQAK